MSATRSQKTLPLTSKIVSEARIQARARERSSSCVKFLPRGGAIVQGSFEVVNRKWIKWNGKAVRYMLFEELAEIEPEKVKIGLESMVFVGESSAQPIYSPAVHVWSTWLFLIASHSSAPK